MKLNGAKFYAVRLKNESELMHSSSGGAFSALTEAWLSENNVVACCTYNNDEYQTEFHLISSITERNTARGSKYMQSIPGDIYEECLYWLRENPDKKLMFVGMGCQVAGFRRYSELNGVRDRVLLVDIICHGSSSPAIWKDYAHHTENQYNGKITSLSFKDKRNGWMGAKAFARFDDKEVSIRDYMTIFYSCCALRPSCHKCPYAIVERSSDVTIGDFWGVEKAFPDFFDNKGTSLVIIHTENGKQLFRNSKNFVEFREAQKEYCLQHNLIQPTSVSQKRDMFWKDYSHKNIGYIIKKYGEVPMYKKIIKKVATALRGGYCKLGCECFAFICSENAHFREWSVA